MSDKGTALNKRVWALFERAGFKTKPNSQSPAEEAVKVSTKKKRTLDLLAEEASLGVKIIGWNKAAKTLQDSLSVHVNDLMELKSITGAGAALMVITRKNVSEEDRELLREKGVTLWQEPQLSYFEAVVDAIGKWARFEIIKSLGMRTTEERTIHNILALRLAQPFTGSGTNLYMFCAKPEFLLKTGAVFRRAQGHADAYQRIVRKTRLKKIKKFVTQEHAILPPNIIVHLSEKVQWKPVDVPPKAADGSPITLTKDGSEMGYLSIPKEYSSLEIIDGQHRLFGFAEAEPATRENFNLVVLGITGLDTSARRDTFVSINSKHVRMDANLVAYLKHTEDEQLCQRDPELMAIRLAVLMNSRSPFKNRIRLLDFGKQKLTLKGLSGYDLRSLLGPRGLLRKYYPNNTRFEYLEALCLFFSRIRSKFKKEWDDSDRYITATNRGISAFLKLLKSILKTDNSELVKEKIDLYLAALESNWTDGWETAHLRSSYVGSKGWKDFHRDMVKAIRKSYKYFKE